MAINTINTHCTDAKDRLLYQYRSSSFLQGLIESLSCNQIQDMEDVLQDFFNRLDIDASSGDQLDAIGDIVGQNRNGFSDEIYKIFLKGKIGQNVSEGDAERIIDTWKIMTGANVVQLVEQFPAEMLLYTDVAINDPTVFAYAAVLIQNVAAAGVRVSGFVVYDPDEAFGFDITSDPTIKGFSDTGAPTTGGKFASLQVPQIEFAMGSDVSGDILIGGFSDLNDPVAGGIFTSL